MSGRLATGRAASRVPLSALLRPALIAGGMCYLLVSLSPFVFSTWRALDEKRSGEPD
jgi:hypothetical protein